MICYCWESSLEEGPTRRRNILFRDGGLPSRAEDKSLQAGAFSYKVLVSSPESHLLLTKRNHWKMDFFKLMSSLTLLTSAPDMMISGLLLRWRMAVVLGEGTLLRDL